MSAECWACGVDQKPRRPHRADFESEPAWLVACSTWLDFTFPGRVAQRERIAEFARLDIEGDRPRLRARLLGLIEQDAPFTDDERDEFDRLTAAWRRFQTSENTTKKAKTQR